MHSKRVLIAPGDGRHASAIRLLEDEIAAIFSMETRNAVREFRHIERSWDRRWRTSARRSAAQY